MYKRTKEGGRCRGCQGQIQCVLPYAVDTADNYDT